jgi:hypothetical protein
MGFSHQGGFPMYSDMYDSNVSKEQQNIAIRINKAADALKGKTELTKAVEQQRAREYVLNSNALDPSTRLSHTSR